MKKSELRKIIKEEYQKILKEDKININNVPNVINKWFDTYLHNNGIKVKDLEYYHDAGESLMNLLRKYGYEITYKK